MTKQHKSTDRLLVWLRQHGPIEHEGGRAVGAAYEAAVAAGVYTAGTSAWSMLLRALEERGEITREGNLRRIHRIAAVEHEPQAPAEPEHHELEPQGTAPAVTDDPESDERDEGAHELHDVVREPLVGTVHLSLDVDPTMARLVLDLVERGHGVRPVDHDEMKLAIAHEINRATARSAAGMTRVLDRLAETERTVASVVAGMRGLGVSVAASSNGHKPRPIKPDFRSLGVKDSEARRLLTDLALDGWTLSKSSNSHVRATKDGCAALSLSCTPSDHRTVKNERARARAAGAAV